MKLNCLWATLVLALPLTAAPIEFAYAGNHFNGFSTLPRGVAEIPLAAFSFMDGAQTFDIASSPLAVDRFDIATGANSDTTESNVGLVMNTGPFIETSNASSDSSSCDCDDGEQSSQQQDFDEDPGAPEPGAIALTGLGLLALAVLLGGLRRRTAY